MNRVLLTGAAGGVAGQILPWLKLVYPSLVLSDRVVPDWALTASGETFIQADLEDAAALEKAMAGCDGIIHLGGQAVEAPWETIQRANLTGCYNIFEAARKQGVKRVVFASSNHAIGFYSRTRRINSDNRVRPDSRYGVSKAFGEALGSFYADKFDLRVLSIRIGNVADQPADERRLAIWIHPEDLVQLIRIGLEHPALRNEVVYGVSGTDADWWDNSAAKRLGYAPHYHAAQFSDQALANQAKLPADPIADQFQGGGFCSEEFSGTWLPGEG